MKYNEFIALSEQLEKDGSSIDELLEALNENALNEEGEEIDTKAPSAWTWLLSPKAAWAKTQLSKEAKRVKNQVQNDLLEKSYDSILGNQKKILQQAMALIKAGKSKELIAKELGENIKRAKQAQKKQLEIINNGIDQLVDNSSKKIKTYLSKKDLGDKHKLVLENYWILLSMQVRQIIYNIIIKKEEEFIHEIVGNQKDLVNFAKSIGASNYLEELKTKEVELIKTKKANMKKGETVPTKRIFKAGEKYKYKTDANINQEIEIKKVDKKGNLTYVNVANPGTPKNILADGKAIKRIGDLIPTKDSKKTVTPKSDK